MQKPHKCWEYADAFIIPEFSPLELETHIHRMSFQCLSIIRERMTSLCKPGVWNYSGLPNRSFLGLRLFMQMATFAHMHRHVLMRMLGCMETGVSSSFSNASMLLAHLFNFFHHAPLYGQVYLTLWNIIQIWLNLVKLAQAAQIVLQEAGGRPAHGQGVQGLHQRLLQDPNPHWRCFQSRFQRKEATISFFQLPWLRINNF